MTSAMTPTLTTAINEWTEFLGKNNQTLNTAINGFTPVQDLFHTGHQWAEWNKNIDWTVPEAGFRRLRVQSQALKSLGKIQLSALQQERELNFKYLEITANSSHRLTDALLENSTNPQQALAACLETTLDIAKSYQDVFMQQFSLYAQLRSAYSAWTQKTLEDLF